jgi:hypothetical protein
MPRTCCQSFGRQRTGATSLRAIAETLNARGIWSTPTGLSFITCAAPVLSGMPSTTRRAPNVEASVVPALVPVNG